MDPVENKSVSEKGEERAGASPAAAATDEVCPVSGDETATIRLLMTVAEEMSSTLDLDAVLRRVARRLKEHVGYDTFGVLLLDPLGQELRIRFGEGYPPDVIRNWRFGLGQGIVGTAAQTGKAVRVADVRRDPRYIDAGEGVAAELAIPLIVKNRTIGVLDVGSRQPGYFTESHQCLLTLLAGRVATSIENARLFENLQEQARTLSLLHEVSRELTSILDREELLGRVAQLVKRLIDYDLFNVQLWDEEAQLLRPSFMLHQGERVVDQNDHPLGYGISGTAAALRQPVRVPNVHLDPRYVACWLGEEARSELAVPLVFKDRLIGVIDLESTRYNAFSEHHEQMLSTLASYVAIALENARLYEKVVESEKRLESDLSTAREIQRSLLPDAAPRVPGLSLAFAYKPARHVGGDVYDILPYGDGRVAIAVGDVSGKGAAAALYGSLAVGILRGHVVEHPCEPEEMLAQLNQHLRQPRLTNRFVAMCFSVYDSSSRVLTVANAGFTRPRLLRRGQVEEVGVDGVPLGLLPDIRYEQKKLALQVGDAVIFCSDGIHECVNGRLEEFGDSRLEEILVELGGGSAQQIASGILRASDRYAEGPTGAPDDRTVVVLKVTPE
jgi:sigma-B regulation protein RsbU (phosphoserine phosphatase)